MPPNKVCKTKEILNAIENFNATHSNQNAVVYDLDDIKNLYFKDPVTSRKTMTSYIRTLNKGTQLTINNDAYKLTQAIDAQYIMVPVYNVYQLYLQAEEEEYPIFDSNIREYLGSSGTVNKKIRDTLKDEDDRKNFFFYNNGLTIIVKSIKNKGYEEGLKTYEIQDPQIVNGCQTVSTISEVCSGWPRDTIQEDFKNTFVMLKVLVIPNDRKEMEELRKNIVTYNNFQNSIDQKTFEANATEFKRLQIEFKRKGMLVCIKQSDKYQYTKKEYKTSADLLNLNYELLQKFGLNNLKNINDFLVPLEKLLQVILAFISTPQIATQKKSKLLQANSEQNKKVLDFIRRNDVTINERHP